MQLSQNIPKCLLFIIIHIFGTHFAINLFYLHNLKTQTMEQQPQRTCERTKWKQKQNRVTSHSNWPRVLLFYLAHIQWNGIIKGRLDWLTSESQGRFLVNNILFDSAWCLVMAQIQFSLIKKQRLDIQNTSLLPTPLRPITSHFWLTVHTLILPKVHVIFVSITLTLVILGFPKLFPGLFA